MFVKFLLVYMLTLVISFNAQAGTYDITSAIQIEPIMYAHKKFAKHSYDKVSSYELEEIVRKEALNYFAKIEMFSPAVPTNFFLILNLTYGSYYQYGGYEKFNPDIYCVTLKYEGNAAGKMDCDEDSVEDAVEGVFEVFEDDEDELLESVEASKRKIVWFDAIDKGVVYDNQDNPFPVKKDRHKKLSFKANIRSMLGRYFQDGDEPISVFKSEDLISVILSSQENITKHKGILLEIISKTPNRHRMLGFYLHQAVRVNAPLDIIEAIGAKKNYEYDKFLDADGNTPLMHAVWSDNIELAKFFLLSKSNPKLKNKAGIGLVHYAAAATPIRKGFHLLDFVLKQKLDINAVSDDGAFPLSMAILFNNAGGRPMHGIDLVNGFVKRHSKIDLPVKARGKAFSPLMQSVYYKDYATGKRLLELGVNVEQHPKGLATTLQIAANNQDYSFVKLLLKKGTKPNVIGPDGKTALHFAYPKAQQSVTPEIYKIIKLLVANGADVSIKNTAGKTAERAYTEVREAYLEEQRIIAHNKRMRELRIEQARLERERQERLRREAEAEKEKSGINWGKAMTMGVGFLIGGGSGLDAEAQAKTIMGIIQDSQAGVSGVSNTTSALNSATQRYKQEKDFGDTRKNNNAQDSGSKKPYIEAYTFSCPTGGESTIQVPYFTKSCLSAAKEFAKIQVCNIVNDYSRVEQQCLSLCGDSQCVEGRGIKTKTY